MDAEILDWLERSHTLQTSVEALYVVDGYEVTVLRHDDVISGPWHGKTLREAYKLAMQNWEYAGPVVK